MKRTSDNDGLSPDARSARLERAIGVAMANWAHVEDGMVKVLRSGLGCSLKKAGIVWHSTVSFASKVEMTDNVLAQDSDDITLNYWSQLAAYARDLSTIRNQIAHRETILVLDNAKPGELYRKGIPALAPHAWDYTKKGRRQAKRYMFADDVEFAGRSFMYLHMKLSEFYLILDEHAPSQGIFLEPLVRLQRTDGAMPQS